MTLIWLVVIEADVLYVYSPHEVVTSKLWREISDSSWPVVVKADVLSVYSLCEAVPSNLSVRGQQCIYTLGIVTSVALRGICVLICAIKMY